MKIKIKKYNRSPLPFKGQKRNFLDTFRQILIEKYSDKFAYVDLFGGSGLLSHSVKHLYLNSEVIFNDFDNFTARLTTIDQTNETLEQIRTILINHPRGKRIEGIEREKILSLLKEKQKDEIVDWITLSSSLLFSGRDALSYQELEKATLYNSVIKNNYDASGYLAGVKTVNLDYRAVFNKYKDLEHVVFLIDPPYLSTNTKTYKNNDYWRLKDYLDVLTLTSTGSNYFYFTSEKSQIIELSRWLECLNLGYECFERANVKKVKNSLGNAPSYTDIMLYT